MSHTPSKRRAPDDPEPNQNDAESGGCKKNESSYKRSAKDVDGLLPGQIPARCMCGVHCIEGRAIFDCVDAQDQSWEEGRPGL